MMGSDTVALHELHAAPRLNRAQYTTVMTGGGCARWTSAAPTKKVVDAVVLVAFIQGKRFTTVRPAVVAGSTGRRKSGRITVRFPMTASAVGNISELYAFENKVHVTVPALCSSREIMRSNDALVMEPGTRRGNPARNDGL